MWHVNGVGQHVWHTVPVTNHTEALAAAADAYRRAAVAQEQARAALTEAVRAAHADKVRQVDILKATGHVWTREQVRRVCLVCEPDD
jgi:hypothetical protein